MFLSVVEEGDFSAAARRLRMTPSAVSKIVGRLESRLGVRLLQRSTRRIGLTVEGSAYADTVRRILNDIDEAERAIQSGAEPRGRLRVNLPSAFGHRLVVPLLPAFIERYPAIELELTFTDAVVDLLEEGADVAVRVAASSDSSLVMRRLAPNRRIICAAPRYLERHGIPRTPDDLHRHVCLGFTSRGGLNIWEFDRPGAGRTKHANPQPDRGQQHGSPARAGAGRRRDRPHVGDIGRAGHRRRPIDRGADRLQ